MTDFIDYVRKRNPHQPEFLQAVSEFYECIAPVLEKYPVYKEHKILERLTEPERLVSFRVVWEDDNGNIQVNRGYRIQMCGAIGPFKGGLRFHPTVNESILKFLAFEQIFKNSLTGLPLGGGKGGSDFDPKGKSDREIMRFCQAFMNELSRHIGPDTDVPAGDIGVGGREIGYLFGQYKKIKNEFTGVLTGKGLTYGGSLIRPEATGYGAVYFAREMLHTKGESMKGKRCLISGSGNVAQYAIEKIIDLGGIVVTASDSDGYIYDPKGFNKEKLAFLMELKNVKRGRISEYAEKYPKVEFMQTHEKLGHNPLWKHDAYCAFPCATQNEINEKDAMHLVQGGVKLVCEGANMPCTNQSIEIFHEHKVLYAPGKASNAGGVATSGLEMTQNSIRTSWTRYEVDKKLQDIMKNIHDVCLVYAEEFGQPRNYQLGANIAGFLKVADAMVEQGLV